VTDTADLTAMATVPDGRQSPAARPGAACTNDSAPAPQGMRFASRGAACPSGAAADHAGSPGGGHPGSAPATNPLSYPADAGRTWLRGAMAALAVLAAAAAVVSWDAQYVMVHEVKHSPVIAALEAGIPDAGALIFATLGIALALHGRRALRSRVLNVACVAISLAMNAIAAEHGWRNVAIWVMPAAIYALASDTLIGVVRAWALARMQATGLALAGEEVTPLAMAGTCLLWLLRLALAPASTLAGFRRWVVEECPVAPRRKALATQPAQPVETALPPSQLGRLSRRRSRDGKPRKQDLLIALASQRYDLQHLPLNRVARIAGEIGAEVNLHQGTARRVLKAHVQALHDSTTDDPTEARS
jgi:hypothetical protein